MHATQIIIWVLTLGLTLSAAVLDWRSRRIPNWLTVPGLLLGVTAHTVLSGWHGTLFALEGAGLALLILLPLVLLRGLGAGDWKLMGAVGAMLGPVLLLFVLSGSILASGLMAVAYMMRTGRVVETLRNLWVLLKGFLSFGLRAHPQISLDNPKLMKLPFGVAVAVATLICFCAAQWVV
jgi:prepilin peptidase CpaA